MDSNKNVVGLFKTYETANQAVMDLGEAGYSKDQVDIIARENIISKHTKAQDDVEQDVGEGTVAGARTGALVGGIAGVVVGLGALLVPGIGPVITLGTLSTAIGSAAVGAGVGAAGGGVIGSLTGLGLADEEAEVYAEGVKRGGILVAVEDVEDTDEVHAIFKQNHALDAKTMRQEWMQSGWEGFDPEVNVDDNYPRL